MSSFLKSLFNSNKHKKLSEEWTNAREPVADGVTFYVRYLGASLVDDAKSESSTAAGVRRVIHAAKASARRPERVSLLVSMAGVKIHSINSGRSIMDTSIYKISYCSADMHYDQVLAFVASNEDESCECHAFLCPKRKIAEAIAVSIAQAFSMAYECWKLAIEAKRNGSSAISSEQMEGRGEDSPTKEDKDLSRGSSPNRSPCYSSPPSEVSSTSGYQSSTPGLLLDFDYSEGGGYQHSSPRNNRKQWVEFGSKTSLPMGSYCDEGAFETWELSPTSGQPPCAEPGLVGHSGTRRPTRTCSFSSRRGSMASGSRFSLSDCEQLLAKA